MPCYTEPPSEREAEEKRLNTLLDEIGDNTKRTEYGNIYGKMRGLSLDDMTRKLCTFCKGRNVKGYSLELQIWWRDHQKWDLKRKLAARAKLKEKTVKARALSKLTREEKKALGL